MRAGGILELGLAALLRMVAGGSIRRKMRRIALLAALAGLAALALLAAAGSALAALWLWLLPRMGPVDSALIVTGSLVAFSVMMLFTAWLVARRPRRSGAAQGVLQWLKDRSNEDQAALLLAAVLAGLVAGRESAKSSRSKPGGP